MKKIITAIGNENLNIELKKEKNIEIISNDIQYKEGILEILEKYQDIDFLILNSLLEGEISLEELLIEINIINKKIKIIIILENKNDELEKKLYEKNIYKILYNNQIEIPELLDIIFEEKIDNKDLKEEINKLKELILKKDEENKLLKENKINTKNKLIKNIKLKKDILNEEIINKNIEGNAERKLDKNKLNIKPKNKIEKLINLFKNNKINNNLNYKRNKIIKNGKINNNKIICNDIVNNYKKQKTKIICITGSNESGKSIISVNLAKINMYLKNKILIIDFDFINNSISTILGAKKIPTEIYNKENILSYLIKINKKIDLLTYSSITELSKNNINILNIEQNNFEKTNNYPNNNYKNYFNENIFNKNIEKLKENYDLIIIDTNCNELINYIKFLINYIDICLFISDTNLLEINKSIKKLDYLINTLNIDKNKINIIFNKYNSNSIRKKFLKNIFNGFNILGFFNYSEIYNRLINKNNKYNFCDKKVRMEYLEINDKINKILIN